MAHGKGSPAKFELGGVALSTEADLLRLVEDMPAAKLVEIWNNLSGVTPVKKFTDRKTAVRRIWGAVQATAAIAKPLGVRQRPSAAGTKAEQIIVLLRRPDGATLGELMKATNWQAHSVRGFISGQLGKKQRLKIRSFRRDGERVYKIR
jgi:hypothetical protein